MSAATAADGLPKQIRAIDEQGRAVEAVSGGSRTIDIPAAQFEAATDQFVDEVEARVSVRVAGDRALSELKDELREERAQAPLAAECKRQALAGI